MGAVVAIAEPPLLSVRRLTRDFGGLRAVDHVFLDVEAGEIRALIGPNGAGKTTLVGLICGRLPVTTGRIYLDGEDVTYLPAHLRVRRGLAYTFQITSVFGGLSVLDNAALAAQRRLSRASNAGLRRAALDALDRVGLADQANAKADALSHGHQRLLELAMGLASKPRLLMLDEPTQGLAEGEIDRFIALAREAAREATLLLIEHNMDVVMALADRITVLDSGAVLADGPAERIRRDPAVRRAYLGDSLDAASGA